MRNINPDTETAFSGAYFFPILFVWVDWPGDPLRLHSGSGLVDWGGYTWKGVGSFGSVVVPEETLGGVPDEFYLSLVCSLPELVEYTDVSIRQRECSVWVGASTDPGGGSLVGTPVEMSTGTMDTMDLDSTQSEDNGSVVTDYTLTVGVTVGPGFRVSASIVHSHEDQSHKYPGDTAGKRLVLATARAEKTFWPEP